MRGRTISSLWWKDAMERLIPPAVDEAEPKPAEKRRRRVVEFALHPGFVTGRVQDGAGKSFRVEIGFTVISEEAWREILQSFFKESLFLASFLAGAVPREVAAIFEAHHLPLFPRSAAEISLRCDCSPKALPCIHQSMVWGKVLERMGEDPFAIFLLRGHPRDELLSALRQMRSEELSKMLSDEALPPTVESDHARTAALTEYYLAKPTLKELSYHIRADDLPAALLRWLEPMPVGDAADNLDFLLEDAYGHVARRAQIFGLGMKK